MKRGMAFLDLIALTTESDQDARRIPVPTLGSCARYSVQRCPAGVTTSHKFCFPPPQKPDHVYCIWQVEMFASRLRLATRIRAEVIASSSTETQLVSSVAGTKPKPVRTWKVVWDSPEKLEIEAKRLAAKRKPRAKKKVLIPEASALLPSDNPQLECGGEEVSEGVQPRKRISGEEDALVSLNFERPT